MVPRENKNNAYAKFGGKTEYYGIFQNGQLMPYAIDIFYFACVSEGVILRSAIIPKLLIFLG